MSALTHDVLAYLAGHNVMTLATTGPEGTWAAAVFYASDGFRFYFLSSPNSRHGRNIAANPGIAATVQEDYADWREIKGIQLEGTAHVLEEGARDEARRLYGSKFPLVEDPQRVPVEVAAALSRVVWYEVLPSRLYFLDNSHGLGHREQVPLDES